MTVEQEVENRLAKLQPDIDVLLVECLSNGHLRVFIDHAAGVTLQMCEEVSHSLNDFRDRYSLEVSSPGAERPLRRPDHFRRYLGREARVRTRERHNGRRSFTGELMGASDETVTIAVPEGLLSIKYDDIQRSNLTGE